MTSYIHFHPTGRETRDCDSHDVILTALQFDGTGVRALREAVAIACGNPRAVLHVVHVLGPRLETQSEMELIASARAELRGYIDRVCAGRLRITCHIRSGAVPDAILETAMSIDATLIIVGTHHRLDFMKSTPGSVAERVLSDAHCAVLVAIARRSASPTASMHFAAPSEALGDPADYQEVIESYRAAVGQI